MTLAELKEQRQEQQRKQQIKETQRQYATLIKEIENMGMQGLTVGPTWDAKVDRANELQDKLKSGKPMPRREKRQLERGGWG